MSSKQLIILIEDEKNWLDTISEFIIKHFDVRLETYSSFFDAQQRLIKVPCDFDLLITDIYSSTSRDQVGLKFANFVSAQSKIPVIIISGDSDLVKSAARDANVINIFDKGEFEYLDFINSIAKVIKPRKEKSL